MKTASERPDETMKVDIIEHNRQKTSVKAIFAETCFCQDVGYYVNLGWILSKWWPVWVCSPAKINAFVYDIAALNMFW